MKKNISNKVFSSLLKLYPNPKTELNYINKFTFLISVVLSAQATDVSVNIATKKLFKIIKTPKQMIQLGETKLKKFIKTIGLYNSKSKNIILLSNSLLNNYKGKIPNEFDKLISLPGVGNKTASVYQNTILKLPRIAVDTHVFRVSNRIGLVSEETPDLTQKALEKTVPNKWLMSAHHLLILHGRSLCKARKPLCDYCSIKNNCNFYSHLNRQ